MMNCYLKVPVRTVWLMPSFLLFCLGAFASQDSARIDIEAKNISFESALKKIEQQTGFDFFYSARELDAKERIPVVNLKGVTIGQALNVLLAGKDVVWQIRNNVVILSKKKPAVDALGPATDTVPKFTVTGVVTDRSGTHLPGVTVSIEGQTRGQGTDANGVFSFSSVSPNTILVFSSVGFETKLVRVNSGRPLSITLDTLVRDIQAVEVVSTGYQQMARQRSAGSYEYVGEKLLNRRVSTNVLDRLEGVVAGVVFNKNIVGRPNESSVSIRSRGTILANPNPLIILDNFPYAGDISTINPLDIESITILKDAAAAAIWGAYSGNGVIVITTKKGKNNQPLKVSFNANFTVGEKPDLKYVPKLSSASYIDYEKYLFENKYYSGQENSSLKPLLSPAVEILIQRRDGKISAAQADELLNALSGIDVRDQFKSQVYRPSTSQQYLVNVSGGGNAHSFYVSLGYDRNGMSQKENRNDRITLTAKNNFSFFKSKLQANVGVYYAKRNSSNAAVSSAGVPFPYISLGTVKNPLPVARTYRQKFLDTAGAGRLLDWHYYPLAEMGMNPNDLEANDYRFDAELRYQLVKGLNIIGSYQYANGVAENNVLNDANSFYSRDLINSYSQLDYTTGSVSRAIPLGGILDRTNDNYKSYNLRGQINYVRNFNNIHDINVVAGVEQRELINNRLNKRIYGYDRETQSEVLVDFFKDNPTFNSQGLRKIPNPFGAASQLNTNNRFRSYFFAATYGLLNRYTLSASIRRDESNLFGVKANQKGVPLWSIGSAWNIAEENFYEISWLPSLRLRGTFGYNGNIDNSLSALMTAVAGANNTFGFPTLLLRNAPNPSLRWEKSKIVNLGLDFAFIKNRVFGSVEWYNKSGVDLISTSPIDPTIGVSSFTGNTANMNGRGIDITLNAVLIDRTFKWMSKILFSYAVDEVTQYNLRIGLLNTLISGSSMSPIVGKPLYSMFAYKWAGLEPSTGDPQSYLDGKLSKDYLALYRSTDVNNAAYIGPAKPQVFGSFMNTFSYKGYSLSVNLTYKFKYFFRRPALDYSAIISNGGTSDGDYRQRWKNPGDEALTNVPSRRYPIAAFRDVIYTNADINILKGDHIRVQDVRLDIPVVIRQSDKKYPLNFFLYANNIGVLWAANHYNIDPDFVGSIKAPKQYSLGCSMNF